MTCSKVCALKLFSVSMIFYTESELYLEIICKLCVILFLDAEKCSTLTTLSYRSVALLFIHTMHQLLCCS